MHMNLGDYALSTAIALERLRAEETFEMVDIDGLADSVTAMLAHYGDRIMEYPNLSGVSGLAADDGLLSAMSNVTGKQGHSSFPLSGHIYYGKELIEDLYADAFDLMAEIDQAVRSSHVSLELVHKLCRFHMGFLAHEQLERRTRSPRRFAA